MNAQAKLGTSTPTIYIAGHFHSDRFSQTCWCNKHGFVYFALRGVTGRILNVIIFWSLKIVLILEKSGNPDHLGLRCLPKYLFTGIQNENDWGRIYICHKYQSLIY